MKVVQSRIQSLSLYLTSRSLRCHHTTPLSWKIGDAVLTLLIKR